MTNIFSKGESIYFGEYEVRELIHNGARIQWHANLQNRNKHEHMVDTHDSSFLQTSYYVLATSQTTREPREHKDKNDSSKSDCHWKRPLKKASVSGDDPDGRGSSALRVPDVPPLSPLNDHLEGLIELDSDESLMGPHVVDSTIKEVGTSKTFVSKPAKQSLRPFAFLKEIRQGKLTVGGKDIGSPSSKGDACPKVPLQKVGENVVSNFFKKTAFCVWEDIQDKIMRTPFEYIPRLRPEIATILSGIENIHADGLTPLDEYLNNYLKRKAEAIDQQELEVAKLQDEVNTLESTPSITEEAIEILATVCRSMEVARE
ncbi:hypothetical protein E5676_scaffold46G001590 [Cucumis melo var. makuwa]|uniref:Uncharacterized protein n=1 Tax=Cucumis melo var. makuwa TaxID=1194695 RepID=A0A5D3BYA2_CUCMM|nr:hypothetical protein E5676_scaffold46G001590 [Cucumis melo var. makuwa]